MEKEAPHPSECLSFVTTTSFDAIVPVSPHTPQFNFFDKGAALLSRQIEDAVAETGVARVNTSLELSRLPLQALTAVKQEHSANTRQSVKLYSNALLWATLFCFFIFTRQFESLASPGVWMNVLPGFKEKYGKWVPLTDDVDGHYTIPKPWRRALLYSHSGGAVIGLLTCNVPVERYGYRRTLLGATALLVSFSFLSFFAPNLRTLVAAQVLRAIPFKAFEPLVITYVAEIMPLMLRGYCLAGINLFSSSGDLASAGLYQLLYALENLWSWRLTSVVIWVCTLPLFCIAYWAPESPWNLVRRHQSNEAQKSLRRLVRLQDDIDAGGIITMEHTEQLQAPDAGTQGFWRQHMYVGCFTGSNLRRTEISCCIFLVAGRGCSYLIQFAYSYIGDYNQDVGWMTWASSGTAFFGSLCSLFLLRYLGRRAIFLLGLAAIALLSICAGTIGCFEINDALACVMQTVVMLTYFVLFCTLAPISQCYASEIPSLRLKLKTAILVRVLDVVIGTVVKVPTIAYQYEPQLGAGFITAGFFILFFIYCFFRLPETRGLSYYELDILFSKGVSARKFHVIQKDLEERGYFELTAGDAGRTAWH